MWVLEQPKKSKLKIVIIVGVVFVGIVLVLSLVLYLTGRSSRKPAIELANQQQNTQQAKPEKPAEDANAPAAIPDGFVKITKIAIALDFLPTTLFHRLNDPAHLILRLVG